MKYLLILACALLGGCSSSGGDLQANWVPIDGIYDALAQQLENPPGEGRSAELLDSMRLRRDRRPGVQALVWRTRYWEARMLVPQGRWDEALALLEQAAREVDASKYAYDRIRILSLESQIRLLRGDYPASYRGYRETGDYYRRVGDNRMLASIYVNSGVIMQALADWQRAIEFFEKADSLFALSGADAYRIKNRLNFSNALYRQGEREKAVRMLDTLLRTPECLADTLFRINVLLSHCSYAETHRGEAAEAYRLARLCADGKLTAKSAANLGIERLNEGRPEEALPLLRQALDYAAAAEDNEFLLPALENTARALYATGRIDSAYRTLNEFSAARDSLDAAGSLAEIRLMENRADIEQYETRLSYLRERARWQRRLTALIVASIISLAAFVCYVFWERRRRERILKQLRETENKELNMRLEHERLRSEHLRREVDLRNRELADRVMAINTRNRMLGELQQCIEKERADAQLSAAVADRLERCIRLRQTHPEEEEAFFRVHFEGIYPGFLERLKQAHPDLTEHELRFCAYLRMGMENKTIAHLRSVQPDSIKKLRFRIRKKLAFTADCSLEEYLHTI